MTIQAASRFLLGALVANEALTAVERQTQRSNQYNRAIARARLLNRKLLVVGAPQGGIYTAIMPSYGCGDVCVDLEGCGDCPVQLHHDITKPLPFPDNSMVVFESCVLELVNDPWRGWNEMQRVAGSPENFFMARVQSNTLTAGFYPGAQWSLENQVQIGSTGPVMRKVDTQRDTSIAMIGLLLLGSFWPR